VIRRSSLAWLAVALSWSGHASALDSESFTLETGSPDALCPELEATREIVARRLGSLLVEGRKGWRARYTIGHAPAGYPRDFVRLELFNPEGAVELLRDLPIEGDSCRTMSEVIALVLDRHFRGLVAAEPAPQDSAQATTVDPPAETIAVHPQTVREPPVPSSSDLAERGPRISAEYAATVARPWLGLRVSSALGTRIEVGLAARFGLTAIEEREPQGAKVEAKAATSRATVAWRLALPPGLLHLGPALSLAIERATTHGLAYHTDRTRALWRGGVEAGFVAPVGRGLFVEAATSLDFLVASASGRLFVAGREVLPPQAMTVGWSLGFGYAWSK
jgi:hypothetical protein